MDSAPGTSLSAVRVLVLFAGHRLYGQERANIEVIRSLHELGINARFITSTKFGAREIQPELTRHNLEWTTAPFGYHWGRYLLSRQFHLVGVNLVGALATNWRIWQEVRAWKPTHLYVSSSLHYGYAQLAINRLDLPLILRAGDEPPMHSPLHRWISRHLLRRADIVVCISKYIAARYAALGVPQSKLRLIYNYPPERAADAELPALSPVPNGAVVLTYVGQLAEHKGVLVLLDAVERLVESGRNVVLWLVGDAGWDIEFEKRLRSRAQSPALEGRIFFFGYVRNVLHVLEGSDVHVCPSIFAEPLSNVVGEAKLCARPSVVFPSGGLPELIEHEVDGYICRDSSSEALVAGIEYFLADGERRQQCGVAAKKSLDQRFGRAAFRQAWSDIFTSTRAAAASRPPFRGANGATQPARPLRVLTVCTSTEVFGAEVITLKLLDGFKRAGHEQLAITSIWTDGEFNRRLAAIGVNEVRLPFGFFSKRLTAQSLRWTASFAVRLPRLWAGWRRTVREFNPDVILITSSRLALPILPLLDRRTPAFLIEHTNLEPTRTRRLIYALLSRRLRGFVAVSDFMATHLQRVGAPAAKVHVVKNGPFSPDDRLRVAQVASLPKAWPRPVRLGIVGQVSRSKGHDILLAAAKLLQREGVQVEVRVFGRGDTEFTAALAADVERSGLQESWKWMGYEADPANIYQNFDICIVPSRFDEPFGMVAAEASAFGLPVIASDRGGLRELVKEGTGGFRFQSGEAADLAEKIKSLIDNEGRAEQIGTEGRQYVFREFAQESMVAGFEKLFIASLARSSET